MEKPCTTVAVRGFLMKWCTYENIICGTCLRKHLYYIYNRSNIKNKWDENNEAYALRRRPKLSENNNLIDHVRGNSCAHQSHYNAGCVLWYVLIFTLYYTVHGDCVNYLPSIPRHCAEKRDRATVLPYK